MKKSTPSGAQQRSRSTYLLLVVLNVLVQKNRAGGRNVTFVSSFSKQDMSLNTRNQERTDYILHDSTAAQNTYYRPTVHSPKVSAPQTRYMTEWQNIVKICLNITKGNTKSYILTAVHKFHNHDFYSQSKWHSNKSSNQSHLSG